MFIPTESTQRKIQQVLHGTYCQPGCSGIWDEYTPCKRGSVLILGLIMPEISREMFPAVRADERQRLGHGAT